MRIVRACRALGLEAVVGVSDVDRDSAAARLADRAVCIGPARATESYLRPETIVQAALGTGCDAIHPGYGFLSENPRLARARARGGDRVRRPAARGHRARRRQAPRARRGGRGRAAARARRRGRGRSTPRARSPRDAGYPVLLKAAGGGGGRGIKLARDAAGLDALFGVAVAEADAAFGDPRLYVERFVAAARHVEVQIAADAHGAVVHLGERDCSVQRRYQKVIEEAPAPSLTPEQRAALTGDAVAFARADRLRQPRDRRVHGRRRDRRALLPRVQLPHPGRAPRHRGGHRPRPRRRADADRRRASRWASRRTTSRSTATRSRRA